MNNYELILTLSGIKTDEILRPIGLKMIESADDATKIELWKFWKPFRECLKLCFSKEETKNGSTFELIKPKSVDTLLSKVKYDKLCKGIEESFGVTAMVLKKKDFPLDIKFEDWKFTSFHVPFIVAYELERDHMLKLLTLVGEQANVLWIRKED